MLLRMSILGYMAGPLVGVAHVPVTVVLSACVLCTPPVNLV